MSVIRKVDGENGGRSKSILFTILILFLVFFVVIPLATSFLFDKKLSGNIAIIPIEGEITSDGSSSYFGSSSVGSKQIVDFIEQADENSNVKVILLEINSPGGSAVASDEIATAVKNAKKPVVALIREAGASGAYWIASASDHIIANRMSITGSIGVVASYLEFSGLMEKYGVGYERMIAGKEKDLGTPYRKLTLEEEGIMQKKLDILHGYFIDEVALNRKLPREKVVELATGEFYLGSEALQLGLVDELGDIHTAEYYINKTYGTGAPEYVRYEPEKGFLQMLTGAEADFAYHFGQGIGSMFVRQDTGLQLK